MFCSLNRAITIFIHCPLTSIYISFVISLGLIKFRQKYNEYLHCMVKTKRDEDKCEMAKLHYQTVCPNSWVSNIMSNIISERVVIERQEGRISRQVFSTVESAPHCLLWTVLQKCCIFSHLRVKLHHSNSIINISNNTLLSPVFANVDLHLGRAARSRSLPGCSPGPPFSRARQTAPLNNQQTHLNHDCLHIVYLSSSCPRLDGVNVIVFNVVYSVSFSLADVV